MNKETQELIKRIEKLEEKTKDVESPNWVKQDIKEKHLEWGKKSDVEMNWDDAKDWCEKQGGRLPTIVELIEAYYGKVEGFDKNYYWSSTTFPNTTTSALDVDFNLGRAYGSSKTSAFYVRCVRGQ